MSTKGLPLLLRVYDFGSSGLAHPQIKEFAVKLSQTRGPLLGLDVGLRHIGVALSDTGRHVAFSQGGFSRKGINDDIDKIQELIQKVPIQAAIVGIPVSPFGHDSSKLQNFVRGYARGVLSQCGVELLAFWNEAFSSQIARDAFMKRSKKRVRNSRLVRKRAVDADAAAIILQDAMDAIKQVQLKD